MDFPHRRHVFASAKFFVSQYGHGTVIAFRLLSHTHHNGSGPSMTMSGGQRDNLGFFLPGNDFGGPLGETESRGVDAAALSA
jgi:hypothetical protein